MPNTIITHQHDSPDLLCRLEYGDESRFLEVVLAANRGLADLGPILPMNNTVILPGSNLPDPEIPVVTLYD